MFSKHAHAWHLDFNSDKALVIKSKEKKLGIWEGVKRASKALVDTNNSDRYSAAGKPIICDHCGCDQFGCGSAQLNTAGMTLLGLDWANRTATTLMCLNCSKIHWFAASPDRR